MKNTKTKQLETKLDQLKTKAIILASQLTPEIVEKHSDMIVDEYGIDRYLEIKAMVS